MRGTSVRGGNGKEGSIGDRASRKDVSVARWGPAVNQRLDPWSTVRGRQAARIAWFAWQGHPPCQGTAPLAVHCQETQGNLPAHSPACPMALCLAPPSCKAMAPSEAQCKQTLRPPWASRPPGQVPAPPWPAALFSEESCGCAFAPRLTGGMANRQWVTGARQVVRRCPQSPRLMLLLPRLPHMPCRRTTARRRTRRRRPPQPHRSPQRLESTRGSFISSGRTAFAWLARVGPPVAIGRRPPIMRQAPPAVNHGHPTADSRSVPDGQLDRLQPFPTMRTIRRRGDHRWIRPAVKTTRRQQMESTSRP